MGRLQPCRRLLGGGLLGVSSLALAACGTTGSATLTPAYPTAPGRQASVAPDGGATSPQKVGRPYQVNGRWYTPSEQPDYDEVGTASWYGNVFQGKPTATGEVFDMYQISAAHKTLPLPSMVEVTNLDNGRKLMVRVNDRGPFVDGRIIDLSRGAADQLGVLRPGLARVRVRYVGPAPAERQTILASTNPPPPSPVTIPRDYARAGPAAAAPAEPKPREYARVAPQSPPPPIPAQTAAPQLAAYSVENDPVAAFQAPAPIAPASWAVQAGTYPELNGAEQAARRLTTAGAPQIRLTRDGGETVYQVVITAPDQAAAAAVQTQVVAKGFPAARILRP